VKSPLRALGGSRLEFPRWTPGSVKLLLPPRQSRGASHAGLVLGAVFEVSNTLGVCFLEKVYHRALLHELRLKGIRELSVELRSAVRRGESAASGKGR